MSSCKLTESADRDLDEVWDYLAQDSIEVADRWIASVAVALEQIGRVPGMGHKREDLTTEPVLFWPIGKYLIVDRKSEEEVEVIAFVHGARDLPAFLRKRK